MEFRRNQLRALRQFTMHGATQIVALLDHVANAENTAAAKQNQVLRLSESRLILSTRGILNLAWVSGQGCSWAEHLLREIQSSP